eukprot:6222200-Amphidinium_carterae.5
MVRRRVRAPSITPEIAPSPVHRTPPDARHASVHIPPGTLQFLAIGIEVFEELRTHTPIVRDYLRACPSDGALRIAAPTLLYLASQFRRIYTRLSTSALHVVDLRSCARSQRRLPPLCNAT